MNKNNILVFSFLLLFILTQLTTSDSFKSTDYKVDTPNQCFNPTVTLHIEAMSPDKYNVTKFSVDQGACLAISFHNSDTVDQAFTIDADPTHNVTAFNIYLISGQTKTLNFQAPDTALTIQYYCSVPGHKQNGMYGSLVVGTMSTNSSSVPTVSMSPGFEYLNVLLLFSLATIIMKLLKRNRI